MEDVVENYIIHKSNLMNYFKCNEDYFVREILEYYWRIKEIDGLFFLAYWKNGEGLNERVIIKQSGKPMILREEEYTMAVIIECVKVSVILFNENEI